MEESHSAGIEIEEVETNENCGDPNQKGVKKRVAQTPPENDAKKPKLSREPSVEVITDSPLKNDTLSPKTPITPRTPKVTKDERERLKKEKLEEKEKQRLERERILEEKRLEKEKLAEEKRLEKEKKEKERLEKKLEEERKKEEKRKELEEKKKEAEEKKRKDEEERMKKEEEKNRKKKEEEEKREAKRKEEEEKKEAKRREEEAIEEKKRRQSAKFFQFFNKVEKKAPEPQKKFSSWYMPFQRKDGMTLAPILTRDPLPEDFDLFKQNKEITSLANFLSTATKLVPVGPASKTKAKLFQFYDNRRPPYYGTWRKKAKSVKGSCPLAEETGIDYEADSDDDWEDEPSDCEELNSDDEGEKDDEEDGEEDDGFFVPPCYLSDGEGEEETTSDGENGENKKDKKPKRVEIDSDNDDDDSNDAERKARLAQRAEEWAKRTEKKKEMVLKPRAVGPVFHTGADQLPEFKNMYAAHFY
ncbi:hypothetical protein CRE_29796 [Caenorhabditis remanei]|uniref:Chromatin assembly factor 1 subunit A dimerization domain-containing protein n=1 Tax=Caenorhabditis remanei TaxID=31234 RepID=E3LVU7_CAERE|nr:hypothetical protein CRE_29796 [Caenorhabditis remanei]